MKPLQGLLFDGIQGNSGQSSVVTRPDFSILADPTSAEAHAALRNFAVAEAYFTSGHSIISLYMPDNFEALQIHLFIRADARLFPGDGNLLLRGVYALQIRQQQAAAMSS
jgi:hypothetical protein